jgi:hypothetical protein
MDLDLFSDDNGRGYLYPLSYILSKQARRFWIGFSVALVHVYIYMRVGSLHIIMEF